MKKIAELTNEQIERAWALAKNIDEEGVSDNLKSDFLGARIKKDDYNKATEFGWVVEYVLDKDFLDKYSTIDADIFCPENVRVISYFNHSENKYEPKGVYTQKIFWDSGNNLYHKIYNIAYIADSCVDALKEIFGLPEDCLSGLRKISYKGM